ncbi:MAG: hypothetical protein EKK60_16890 [Gordonia sp. (in: high G+C Gram-positive bacteria)]|nr:MAG: hypothetical protein EKK60_16890 [Gordonia sp. (in: high G+C Gram-positive bacteria)]
MRRGGPLARRSPLKRKTRLAPVNRKRAAARRAEAFGGRGEAVRGMACLVGQGCHGRIHAAHVRSRGAGGTRRDLVPLCELHHREQHQRGIRTFEAAHGLDLSGEAARVAVELDARGIE